MNTLIYNHKEKSARTQHSASRVCLNYSADTFTFSCEASDFDCIGFDPAQKFVVKIEENGHTKVFSYSHVKRDEEGELLYYIFKSHDQYKFIIFND